MVVRRIRWLVRHLRAHFEVSLYVYFWLNASVLAALVGRPWLGAVGLVTVAPFAVAYVLRCRRSAR